MEKKLAKDVQILNGRMRYRGNLVSIWKFGGEIDKGIKNRKA